MESNKNSNFFTKKSHFINIPIEDPIFIEAYSTLCEEMKSSNPSHFHPELLQKPGKLHMTICTLDIGDDEEKVEKVHQIMTKINKDLVSLASGKVQFNLHSFESMNNVKTTRVVYAKMLRDESYNKLCEIIHLIIKTLLEEDIITEEKLKDLHIEFDKDIQKYKIALHLTLLNVLFLNKVQKKQRMKEWKNIDASDILSYMNERTLPSSDITQIHFSRMREDKKTQKYELLYAYNLN